MKRPFKLIVLVIIFQSFLVTAFASLDYPFKVQGPTASIKNEGVIVSGEGDPLNITFTECKKITVNSYRFIQNDGGPVYHQPAFGKQIKGNILMFNNNHISSTSWLETLTYIPDVDCDRERAKYAPHIKVYESKYFDEDDEEFPPPQQTKNGNNASTTIIIDDNLGQINIGGQNNQNIQNINQTNKTTIINFVVDHLTEISIGSLISISLIIHFIRKKKTKK